MKKLLLFAAVFIVLAPFGVQGQDTETLFSDNISHGGFGGLLFGATSINGEFTYLRGTRGAWIINMNNGDAINLGLARYRTRSNFDAANWSVQGVPQPEMDTQYGGFELEYVYRTNNLFHVSLLTLVGSGTVEYDDPDFDLERTSDNYFVLQPGINLGLNVTTWFRVSGGIFYRYTDGVELAGISGGNEGLSGLSSFLTFRFGWF